MQNKIYVTKPSLPPLEKVYPYLEQIWNSRILTNNGPLHQELEKRLCDYLGVKYVSLFCNATIALLVALKALNLKGNVITTPYSFVATSNSLVWNGLKPKFVDIDLDSNNISPDEIEKNIDGQTSAILAVHCYGIPCDVKSIEKISKKHNLKVIYDAAHCFGANFKNDNIYNYGDLSVISFHATKVFNTFEGGCIVSNSKEMKIKIDNLKNFGFISEDEIVENGINGKMSELNSAIGLCQLEFIEKNITKRKQVFEKFKKLISHKVQFLPIPDNYNYNYSYLPVFFENKKQRDRSYDFLKINHVFSRKYFHPLLSNLDIFKDEFDSIHMLNSTLKCETVLCLPISSEISINEIEYISSLIMENL